MWSSSWICRTGCGPGAVVGAILPFAALLVPPTAASAQDPAACEGVLDDAAKTAEVLPLVPKYRTTYVLVYPDRLAERFTDLAALDDAGVRVGVYAGSSAPEMVGSLSGSRSFDFAEDGPGEAVREILAGNLEAAVLWAPLAGLGILQLDLDYELSMRTVGEPGAMPAFIEGTSETVSEEPPPCAAEVLVLLESYGVLPAEKLVPLDIEELVLLEAPLRDSAAARRGRELYQTHCAKCHGSEAVAAPDALAPVDLLQSVRRFSFPGFLYITLNGREQNGMPGFRGALHRDQVELVYQYVRERSYGALGAADESATGSGRSSP
jgi:mono/diheme cytochrome c family protein